ncbi:hypothetical protein J2S20_002253 [Moryella indoligenes]|uniref:Phage XkdN-like protein n=1 Tax=Moryella indoligenes TaxID=371674 RepID=A0AAE3VCF5_9FIRM|nr:hypothetical protein [Moryella indoligenes]MDQ0153532.1 hypothetical protein [Moryella indoligenes]
MSDLTLAARLMKLDRDKLKEIPTEKVRADRLSKIAGEYIEITIKALSGNAWTNLMSGSYDKKGNFDVERAYEAKAMIVVAGCVEPNLKDHDLMEYYGAATPKDLAKTLFPGGELMDIANRIGMLSGYIESDDEEENSSDDGLDYESVKN